MRVWCVLFVGVASAMHAAGVHGAVGYSFSGIPYLQSFDSLPNSGLPAAPDNESLGNSPFGWADDTSTPASGQTSIVGWYLYHPINRSLNVDLTPGEAGANGHQRLRVTSDAVTTNTGAFYSFGNMVVPPQPPPPAPPLPEIPSLDRALGAIPSAFLAPNGGQMFYGMRLTNNTNQILTEFTVNYTAEQWRDALTSGSFVPNQSVTLDYRFGGTDIQSGTYVELPTGGFDSFVDTGTGNGVNGNLPANRAIGKGATVTDIAWAPGTDLWIRWTHTQYVGNDHGLAIDDVIFTAIPEPTAFSLLALAAAVLCSRRARAAS